MAGKGSKPGERRGGRAKGTPNKLTRDLKLAIENAFADVGGEKYLAKVAKKQPAVFAQLLGKLLPMQITGKDGGPIESKTSVTTPGSEALLRRIGARLERSAAIGTPEGDAAIDTDGSVLPAEVRAGQGGHGTSVDAGADSGSPT